MQRLVYLSVFSNLDRPLNSIFPRIAIISVYREPYPGQKTGDRHGYNKVRMVNLTPLVAQSVTKAPR